MLPGTPQLLPDSSTVKAHTWPFPFALVSDSALLAEKPQVVITGTFLGNRGKQMNSREVSQAGFDWMGYLVTGFLLLIAFLWYFFRDRLLQLFRLPGFARRGRTADPLQSSQGIILNIILTVNFVTGMTLLAYLGSQYLFPYIHGEKPLIVVLGIILTLIAGVFILKMTIISLTGFVFNTRQASIYQRKLYFQMNKLAGILLMPVLFLAIYHPGPAFLLAGLLLLIAAQILKWYASFFNVISVPGISLFHIIVYLCTLEIVPILVIIKLLNSGLA